MAAADLPGTRHGAGGGAVGRIVLSSAALALSWMLLLRGVDPVPTWFYVFAWYPTLVLLDAVASRLSGAPSLFARPTLVVSLFAWSAVVWLVFEAANFRLRNWYYVLLPAQAGERWAGILLSFATVVPAVVLAERLLAAAGLFRRGRGPSIVVRPGDLKGAAALGFATGAMSLLWPRPFFPLIWGAAFLLAEPVVYSRAPHLSLARDLERGDWGRVGRLMLGGLGIGVLWEAYNHWAEAGWIYTVPWLEELKLFEMPPFGFVGFPVFALEAWAMYAALAALRVAVPVAGASTLLPRRALGAGLLAAGFAAAVLAGMERYTISSVRIRSGANPAAAETATAELAGLRGMGTEHARALAHRGIANSCELARADSEMLADELRAATGRARPTAPEVRVWTRAAMEDCRSAR